MRRKREQRGDEVRETGEGGSEIKEPDCTGPGGSRIKEPDYTGSYRPTEGFSFTLNKGGLRGF